MSPRPLRDVVLQVWGSAGDVFPMLELGKELRRRGHRVTVITNCVFEAPITALGLRFVACDTPAAYQAFLRHGEQLFTEAGLAALFDDYVLPRLLPDVTLLLDHVHGDTLLITNNLTSWAPLIVAERTGAEIVTLFLSPAYAADQAAEIGWLARAGGAVNAARGAVGLPEVTDWTRFLTAPKLQLAAWPVWFADIDPRWIIPVVPVGFLHNHEAESGGGAELAIRFIESGEPPVLISGGSSRFIRPAFYELAADACARAGQRGLIACPDASLVPARLPPSVVAFPPLPFADIVPRVRAMIHHGGYGVSVRALASATPQLVLASGSDRPDNGRRLEALGVARTLEEDQWDPQRAGRALEDLLTSTAVRERCAHWAAELARPGTSSASRAADLITGLITGSITGATP